MSQFTHFLEIFGQKKCLFGSKTVSLGQEVHYYMVCIAYFTELILHISDYPLNDAFDAKIVHTRLTKIFIAIFAPDEWLSSSATLSSSSIQQTTQWKVKFTTQSCRALNFKVAKECWKRWKFPKFMYIYGIICDFMQKITRNTQEIKSADFTL